MMEVATRRISVDEYYRMAEAGILPPDDRHKHSKRPQLPSVKIDGTGILEPSER
jgi:hypothetical protein